MKYDVKNYSDTDVLTTTEENDITLDKDSASLIFQMFSKNIYSNPIGSIVREITSNCFDSHVEANVNTPVVIRKDLDSLTNTHYISFIDYGIGMSPERIKNIFSVMFSSTKRMDNTQIGAFGLGSKVPLAYKRSTGFGAGEYDNSYFVITKYNNLEYTYQIYEGKNGPRITLLNTSLTTDHNGTEVRIPVLERDMQSFSKEMVRQLYYFENIVFEGFDDDYHYGETLMNEYQIIRGKSFLFRGNEYQDYIHICLGRVAYPIDYNILGLSSSDYRLPIALRLEVGDIGVTVSRESLDYSESTIKMLKKKLEIAKKEVFELLIKQYDNIVTLEDYFKFKSGFGKLNFSNGSSINLSNLIKQSDVDFSNFKYQFMKMPNDKQLFHFFFDTNTYGKKPNRSRYSSTYVFDGGYEALEKNTNLLYIEDVFTRKVVKQAYLKSLHSMYHIIKKRNICDNIMRQEIAELFNVHIADVVDANGKPVTFVQELLDMQEEYFDIVRNHASDYDNVEVPETFVISRKQRNIMTKELRNTTIPVKFMGSRTKYRVKLEMLFDYKCPIFYGNQEDEMKLHRAHQLFCNLFDDNIPVTYYNEYNGNKFENRRSGNYKKSIMFIMLAEGNLKYMKYCKKAYKVDQFFNKILYRKTDVIMQYFQTYGIIEKYNMVDSLYKEKRFVEIDKTWGRKIIDLKTSIEAIPVESRNTDIGKLKYILSNFFNLTDVKQTPEQLKLLKQIDEIMLLQDINNGILKYIDMPYDFNRADKELINILKKIMVL